MQILNRPLEVVVIIIEIEFTLIQEVIGLLLKSGHNAIELGGEHLNAFDLALLQARIDADRVEHVDDFLASPRERFELAEYVHFRNIERPFVGHLRNLLFRSLKAILVLVTEPYAVIQLAYEFRLRL